MHDQDKLQERVDLSLDNRQIFLLFSASAVVLSLVFALGVVVGKRVTRAALVEPANDPLAMLDQIDTKHNQGDDDLAFPAALTEAPSTQAPATEPPPALAEPPKAPAAKVPAAAAKAPAAPAPAKVVPPKAPAPPAIKPVLPPAKPPVQLAQKTPSGKSKTKKPTKAGKTGTFTLQISSFQDRAEAEQFVKKLSEAGLDPYMVSAEIPGRGVWYRVRMGHFKDWQQALKAKKQFEKSQQAIAYVARL